MGTPQTFGDITVLIVDIVQALIPLLAGIALAVFFWGLIRFIYKVGSGDEKAVSEGKNLMIWGLVAIFILISIWGILRLLTSSVGFSFGIPQLPT